MFWRQIATGEYQNVAKKCPRGITQKQRLQLISLPSEEVRKNVWLISQRSFWL
jgi:hypothetical protein